MVLRNYSSLTITVYLHTVIWFPIFLSNKVSWPTVVDGDGKGSFYIAIKPRCRGGWYPFLWIAALTLDLYLKMLRVKYALSIIFWVLGMTRPGIEPQTIGEQSNHYANKSFFKEIYSNHKWDTNWYDHFGRYG